MSGFLYSEDFFSQLGQISITFPQYYASGGRLMDRSLIRRSAIQFPQVHLSMYPWTLTLQLLIAAISGIMIYSQYMQTVT